MTPQARLAAAALPAVLLAFAPPACERLATNLGGGVGPESGVLRAKLPGEARGVAHVKRLTDGIAAEPGDPSRTDLTALFLGGDASATWDLGRDMPVRCALVDADGDDRYTLALSSDGRTFAPLWTAEPDEDRGQQLRAGRALRGAGRYLRLSASGGDGRWSVSEVSAWSDCPTSWPPLAMQRGADNEGAVRLKIWGFGVSALVYLLLYRRRSPDWAKLLGVVPAGFGIALAIQVAEDWPLAKTPTLMLAAAVAAVVLVAAARLIAARRSRAAAAAELPPTS